jgi:multiple sugar transport system substrate-binding protein
MKPTKRTIFLLTSIMIITAMFLGSCATPTPETVVVTEEVVVTQEVEVEVVETVEVEVEKTVVVEVEVTPVPEEMPEEKVKISLAGWGPGEAQFQPVWDEIVATYEEMNPNIEIELVGLAYENLRSQLIVQTTAGTAPDIAQIDSIYDLELAELGALAPLDDLMSDEFKADIIPSLLENSTLNGKVYAIPQSPVPHILYQNVMLAEQAGLDPAAEIATFADLEAAAAALGGLGQDADGNPIWGWSIDTSWPLIVAIQTYPILRGFGCDWFDAEGMVTFDSPECVEALTWFKGLVDQGIVGPPGVDIRETRSTFGKSLSGFQVDNTGATGIYRDLSGLGEEYDSHWRYVVWPGATEDSGVGVYYVHSFVVFEQSKHKEEAVKFLEWLLTDPEMYGKYFAAVGAPPPTVSLLEGDPTYDNPKVKTIQAQMDSWARPAPMYPGKFNEISNFVGYAISQSVVQGVDPQEALSAAAANLRLMLGQ